MKKLFVSIITIFAISCSLVMPVSALCSAEQLENGCVSTSILGEEGCSCDDGKGGSVTSMLEFAVDIMSVGVGVAGVIGIIVVGMQYLTAGGNESQTAKAKQRMTEIIVGLIIYAALYALLVWLGVGNN